MSKHYSLALSALLVSHAVHAQATTTIYPTKDNTLYESVAGSLSNGGGSRFFAGTSGNSSVRRGLVAFEIAGQIPAGSRILTVEFNLTAVVASQPSSSPVTLHRVQKDWGEGTSVGSGGQGGGGQATPGDATWIHTFYPGATWQNAGGDFAAAASGSQNVLDVGLYTWGPTTGMAADVQAWLDNPNSNFGWLLLNTETTAQTAKGFASKDDTSRAKRPRLVVSYAPPAAAFSSGRGCAGSGATPLSLAASSKPVVPNPTFGLDLTGGPRGVRLIAYTANLYPAGVPLGGGCFLYVDPSPMLSAFTLGTGTALRLPIPNQPSLMGTEAMFQGAAGDSVTGALTTSNALRVRLGF